MHKRPLLSSSRQVKNVSGNTCLRHPPMYPLSNAASKAASPAFEPSAAAPEKPLSSRNPFEQGLRREEFKKLEASRPPFQHAAPVTVSQTLDPKWTYGKGVNNTSNSHHKHISIDPYAPDRSMIQNYNLLISAVPRPISFVSTLTKDGARNLAPFSYFQVVDHNPPIFVIGFGPSKDTRANIVDTGECVISVVGEHMIEGVNAASLSVPRGISEWELTGFSAEPSETVKPQRVAEATFSVEGKLLEMKELDYGGKHAREGKPSGALAVIQATRFWVREDALKGDKVDLEVMRPLVQLGGISYGRVRETFELPRPKLREESEDEATGLRKLIEEQGKA